MTVLTVAQAVGAGLEQGSFGGVWVTAPSHSLTVLKEVPCTTQESCPKTSNSSKDQQPTLVPNPLIPG